MKNLNDCLKEIADLFENGNDMYLNHSKVKSIMTEMANNKLVLFEIIKKNLSNPEFLNRTRHYSTLAMDLFENAEVNFVVNIFPSLPSKDTNTSFQSIHHHGNMLLSTVAAFGPGYKTITFNKDFKINETTKETQMTRSKVFLNAFSSYDFVDAFTPHVVFYPESISATYALWTKKTKTDASTTLKKIPIIFKFKSVLKKAISFLGLEKLMGLAVVEDYDFYPENGKLYVLKNRIHYDGSIGTNENFIQNIFHFIQKTGFNDLDFLAKLKLEPTTPNFAKALIEKLINEETVNDLFVAEYNNIEKVNLKYTEVIAVTN